VIVGGTIVIFFGVIVWAFFLANMKHWHRRWLSIFYYFDEMKFFKIIELCCRIERRKKEKKEKNERFLLLIAMTTNWSKYSHNIQQK